MSSFYLNTDLERAAVSVGGSAAIVDDEARHAASVSRVRIGEYISIGNGAGLVLSGPVESVDPSEVVITIDAIRDEPAPTPTIFLAQALAKGDRDEAAVQASCELGVDGVVPWAAERSIVRWQGAKVRKGHDRWTTIVREASKQSMRGWLPEVGPLVTTAQLAALASGPRMLVLEPTATVALSSLELDARDLVIVVGPEGGVAPRELDLLTAAGAEPVRLGGNVLRTSTAGPAAIALVSVALGRW